MQAIESLEFIYGMSFQDTNAYFIRYNLQASGTDVPMFALNGNKKYQIAHTLAATLTEPKSTYLYVGGDQTTDICSKFDYNENVVNSTLISQQFTVKPGG